MSQSDILGSNDALIAIQRSQQQPKKPPTLKKQLHHHHQKPNESPQRRKNQGNISRNGSVVQKISL